MNHKVWVFVLSFILICIVGLILTGVWYKIDVQKCKDVSDNEFYYSKNNCWETMEMPILVWPKMFLLITFIPGIIWAAFLGVYIFDKY